MTTQERRRFRLKRPPLIHVLVHARVNPVLNLEKYIPELQDSLRKIRFVNYQRQETQSITVNPTTDQVSLDTTPNWVFLTNDRRHSIMTSIGHIIIQTNDYNGFAPFLKGVLEVLELVDQKVEGFARRARLGLRYINLIEPHATNGFAEMVGPGLLGLDLGEDEAGNTQRSRRNETVFVRDRGFLTVRYSDLLKQPMLPVGINPHGMVLPRPAWNKSRFGLLDIDRYHEADEPFDLGGIARDLDQFNKDADKAFIGSVTPDALRHWGKEDDK